MLDETFQKLIKTMLSGMKKPGKEASPDVLEAWDEIFSQKQPKKNNSPQNP